METPLVSVILTKNISKQTQEGALAITVSWLLQGTQNNYKLQFLGLPFTILSSGYILSTLEHI